MTGVVGVDGYVCEQGKVKDVKAGEFVWKLVHSEHYATAVNVTVCTKIIYSANDLNKMLSVYATKTKVGTLSYNATSNDVYSYDGYFILGDNIDFASNGERGVYNSGVLAQSFANSGAKETVALMGFNGTFDGRGFAIKNVTFASEGGASFTTGGGLFGAIGAKGVVKNLALVNIALSIESDNAPLATVASGKIDNVYIDLQEVEANASARLAGVACATYGAELSNIYVRKANTATGTRQHSGYVSVYDAAREGKQTTAKNIYIYNDASIQPWIAEMENGTLNPYGGNGTNAFKDVVVYSSIDMAGVYPTFKNFTIEWLSAYNKSQIAFEDDTYWDFTGAEPVFKTKEAQSTPITLSYVPVMEVKGTATVDLSEVTLFTEVTGAKIADVDVFASYANGVLTLDNAKIPNAAKSLGKNVDVTVLTNSGRYVFKADVYTKIITTAEELNKMLSEYAAKTSVGTLGRAIGVEVFSYDGYFLLGNTIDYAKDGARGVYDSGVTYLRTNYYDFNATNPAVMNVAGFKGVFDGQGYAIKNVEFKSTMSANDVCFYTGGGLFGAIATDGVVKNLALKNVALSNTDGNATIAGTCCGTLNNISVDMVMENSTDVRVGALVLGTLGANISNVFVHITGMGGYRLRYGYVSLYDHARIEGETTVSTTVKNVYVARTSGTTQTVGQYLVGTSETGAYNPYDDEAGTFASVKVYDKEKPATTDANYGAFANGVDYQTYAQLATDLAAGNVIVFDDTAYWDLTGSYPTFKTKTVS